MTSVILAVGLALLDVSYKQVLLASTSKNSINAFYNADGAVECALFHDSKLDFGQFGVPPTSSSITCDGSTFSFSNDNGLANSHYYLSTFDIPCASGGTLASVKVYKYDTGKTAIYADGYDTCDASAPARTERGVEAIYGGS